MPRPARKVLISGKGRCNVTNACFDLEELISNVPANPRFLYSAFSNFMPYDTIAFLADMGVETKLKGETEFFPFPIKPLILLMLLLRMQSNAVLKL